LTRSVQLALGSKQLATAEPEAGEPEGDQRAADGHRQRRRDDGRRRC
jgi:hypothetical protein